MKRKGLTLAAGCSDKREENITSQTVQSIPVSAQTQGNTEDMDVPSGGEEQNGDENVTNEGGTDAAAIQAVTELLGNVVSIGDNSVVISQSFTEESQDGGEIMWAPAAGGESEVLVNVIFTADTQYEYKTVKNSGINPEDIETRAGNFSDIKENLSLHMMGSYQGNDFYAVKVSISEFVR